MDVNMISLDPIEFQFEEELYKDRIDFYQRKIGLIEAIQTGTGQLNGILIATVAMDFQFMGEYGILSRRKITRLVKYATNKFLPLILVCAFGGARMQDSREGKNSQRKSLRHCNKAEATLKRRRK
ncbi:hypothetical protein Goklo_012100, partial [Gossypium klotzschianum]|nr:hypothetical protein [Gossypium klotzschianum]